MLINTRSKQSGEWVLEQLNIGATAGRKQAEKVGDATKEQATYAKHRAEEAHQRASDRAKEEL